MDFVCKMWFFERYQQVVDILKNQVLFVQVGQKNPTHIHKQLRNVINAVGLTNNPRDFIKLMYHSSGVLGGVSFAHHLATMQGRKDRIMKNRANVCIAGGRQPSSWEMYCNQAYLHRCGQFPCCDNGGCWHARIKSLNNDPILDKKLCLFPVKTENNTEIPLCLQSISVEQVVDNIRRYQDCFNLYQDLSKCRNKIDREQIVKKYMTNSKKKHIELIKQLYNLTEK